MKKIVEWYKKLDEKKLCYVILFTVILNILLDMDYLIYPALNSIGLPRPSTIFKFIIIPLLMVLLFLKLEKNKKTIIIFGSIYAVILIAYFVLHYYYAKNPTVDFYLTNNFRFSLKDEITNIATLLMPLLFVYVTYRTKIKEKILEKTVLYTSIIISLPIVISDLIGFGQSTYGGTSRGSIIKWFTTDMGLNAKFYTCKFFFAEGNTIGVLLFCILPVLYAFMYMNRNNKKKLVIYIVTILFHSLSMVMIGTRVATYGVFIVPLMMALVLIVLAIFKKEKFALNFIIIALAFSVLFVAVFKATPAYVNSQLEYAVDKELNFNYEKDDFSVKDARDSISKLMNDDVTFYYDQIYVFEQYAWLIRNTPRQYYMDFYNYKFDPYFWLMYTFDIPFEERSSGRQTEQIFMQYKWDNKAQNVHHVFGMGYSSFMNGSIIVEKDFLKELYCYGYTGCALLCGPWALLAIYLIIKTILGFKNKWNMLNIALLAGVCLFLLSAYICSHVLDQFPASFMLAMFSGVLLYRLNEKETIEE